ncbi:MAG TPA: hypothetical protein VM934_18365 [Pyrinomonadaceae bacterium]|nr:hypothetical protein [Pyrinomonadaceae bacterium]
MWLATEARVGRDTSASCYCCAPGLLTPASRATLVFKHNPGRTAKLDNLY